MLKNYLKIALRSLQRNLAYVAINTLGLGVALACCITAYILIAYNIEFDQFHHQDEVANIFRIHAHLQDKSGNGKPVEVVMAPIVMAPMMAEEISGIEGYTRYIHGNGFMRYGEQSFSEEITFADSSFFDLFHFPALNGSVKSFKDKYTIILTKRYAKKYFGDKDPVGKLMVLNFPNDKEIEVVVGATIENPPINNSFVFNVMMRIENFMEINNLSEDNWSDWRDPSTLIRLTSPDHAQTVSSQLKKYQSLRNEAKQDVNVLQYDLHPFKEHIQPNKVRDGSLRSLVPDEPMIVFITLACIILLIACFNLTNTSLSMTSRRLKEIGVRKSIGAQRLEIATQFLLETLLIIILSLAVALLCAQIIVPEFTEMWGLEYGLEDLNGVNLIIALIILIFLAALLAGIYPALFNSKFNPVILLKSSVKIRGTNFLTRILLTFQFSLCVVVLVAGIVFTQNTAFQEKTKFGYEKDKVVSVQIQNKQEADALEAIAKSNPEILSIASSDHQVGLNTYKFPVQIDTSRYEVKHIGVGKNYFETMGFNLIQGRSFDFENVSDRNEGVIVNQAFLKKVGFTEDPLQKSVVVHERKRYIIGIVENHVERLERANEKDPFVFYPAIDEDLKWVHVKVAPSDRAGIQTYLEQEWKETYPGKPFNTFVQDDILFGEARRTNSNLQKIFLFLTILGGILSASGIFALASLNVTRRTKEIGIRKALGATIPSIVLLINREFAILLTLAGVIGSVLGFFGSDWILGIIYLHHMPVSVIVAICSGLVIMAVGLLTTSTTIFRAAKASPVDTLRDE